MKTYLIFFSILYLTFMLCYTFMYIIKNKGNKNIENFLFSHSNIGISLTFLGILATLFSTFTLQGMPNFFKNHGIGAWVFLGITDVCLGGMLIYFGMNFRKLVSIFPGKPKNITELLKTAKYNRIIIFFHLLITTVFLIPYITIQIKGASFLFQNIFPIGETHLFWSCVMVLLMLLYSSFGGIKAIYITDAVQGLIILFTIWAIAYFALKSVGGVESLFTQISLNKPELLSIPGPNGILTWQFLLVSFLSIVIMPYVQPQLTTRILIAKDDKTFLLGTLFFTFFVVLVILPIMFIGFRGSLIEETNYLKEILTKDVPEIFYALFIIGVISASMSTSDSQLMAIGTEWGSFFTKNKLEKNKNAKIYVKTAAFITAFFALILAQSSFKSLILFSIKSFIGTSMLLPIVYSLWIKSKKLKNVLISISIFNVTIFILILLDLIQKNIFGIKIELLLYLLMGTTMIMVYFLNKKTISKALN